MAPDDLVFLEASWTTLVRLPIMIVVSSPAIVAARCDGHEFARCRERPVGGSGAPQNSCPVYVPRLVMPLHTAGPDGQHIQTAKHIRRDTHRRYSGACRRAVVAELGRIEDVSGFSLATIAGRTKSAMERECAYPSGSR
jgi:hypothetical protein